MTPSSEKPDLLPQSLSHRAAIVGSLVAGYLLIFVLLYPLAGRPIVSLGLLPVAFAGWFWGRSAALLGSLCYILGHVLLFILVGLSWLQVARTVGSISLPVLLIGGCAGWLHDLTRRLRSERAQLAREIDERQRLAETLKRSEARLVEREGQLVEREEQLHHLVHQLLLAQEEERRRIAYNLHDGVAQTLGSVHMHLQQYVAQHRPRSAGTRQQLDLIMELLRRAVRETRQLVGDLRPTVLDDLGLGLTLQQEVERLRAEGRTIFYEDQLGKDRLPAMIEVTVFRVIQESLRNSIKHAGPTPITLRVSRDDRHVSALIEDQGRGFAVERLAAVSGPGERVGLRSIRERVALLGGQLLIQSTPGRGTTIHATIPLAESRALLDTLPALRPETARLIGEVQQVVLTDALTAFYNRRGLFEMGGREIERARRHKRPMTAIMLAVDSFLAVNDRYGDEVGDQLLLAVAERCRGQIRSIDIMARYGDEEFVLLLPETGPGGALSVAERLRQAVESTPVETSAGPLAMTISLSIAPWSPAFTSLDELLRADRGPAQASLGGQEPDSA